MKIEKHLKVPTGDIMVISGSKGNLEMLSLGDYGKDVNVKCDAMGLTRQIEKVEHTEMMPLTKKWVVTISTQYGCSMGCKFCDVPKVGPGKNATAQDLVDEVNIALSLHPEITWTERLNIHFARMGEPTWNKDVLKAAIIFNNNLNPAFHVHPVVSTMMPHKNRDLEDFIKAWMFIKNELYAGNAGLQLSINSTDEMERSIMFNGNACTLTEIQSVLQGIKPKGRKITLNFAIAGYKINPDILTRYFSPEDYLIKLTPMHKTNEAIKNNIKTEGDYTQYYPYQEIEENLKAKGYDVLVFIASEYEDLGLITCGNAILSGSLPKVPYQVIK